MGRQQWQPVVAATITLDGQSAGASNASLSDQITNDFGAKRLAVYLKITTKAAGATSNGETYNVYLVRDDQHPTAPYRSDGMGTSAVNPVTAVNATPIGTLTVDGTSDKAFYSDFLVEDIGSKFSFIVENSTGDTTKASGNYLRYRFVD